LIFSAPLYGAGCKYKQAIQGLFTAGTSIVRRSFSEGGMNSSPKTTTALLGCGGQGKRSVANGD